MHIIIDGKQVEFTERDKTIVEVADRGKIGIPAPCYRTNRRNGCCMACVIEVDGNRAYACGTKPKDGMKVTVNRDDLKSLRKERLLAYKNGSAQKCGDSCDCSCNCNTENNTDNAANSKCC